VGGSAEPRAHACAHAPCRAAHDGSCLPRLSPVAAGDTPPTGSAEPDTAHRHTAQEDTAQENTAQEDTAQRDEEATGEEQVANSPRERALELVITIVLSLSALLSAWCAYQSTGLSGEQNRLDSRASVLQLQAFRAEQRATQQAQADLGAFDRWLEASSDGNTVRASFAEQRFSVELDTAFRAWLGAFAARVLSVVIDRNASRENLAGCAIELAVGSLLVLGR